MSASESGLYIALISVHGLIRGHDLELGKDADTGGQTLYVVELARALAKLPSVGRVDLITRLVDDPGVGSDYAQQEEALAEGVNIIRIDAGPTGYLPKEMLWDHLDAFADNTLKYLRDHKRSPHVIHSHYADAGYVGSRLANFLGIPLVHTGHSLGRVKRRRLLASGLSSEEIENRYTMSRRIEAEELTLASAERVITSTHQEINEQYELYDHYQPWKMRVIPPGTNLSHFFPAQGDENETPSAQGINRFLKEPEKPIILALSRPDQRKNISALMTAYGESAQLQEIANLVIVAGNRDDIEELDAGAQEVFKDLLLILDRYDLYGRVALPKHHKREEVPLYYRLAALRKGVFVNPALTEPFGLTLIEAAACGLPIVATEDGGPRDIIANCNNGFLVDALDTQAIADTLLKLLANPEKWEACAKAGLTGVREHYSWDSHAERYLEVLTPLVARTELPPSHATHIRPRTGLYNDRAIFTDIDQNLLGDPDALSQFIHAIRDHRSSTTFGIATGRRLDSALKVMKKYGIPEPDVLITSGGTEIYYAPTLTADQYWQRHIDYHWSPHIVRRIMADLPGLKLQPKEEQSRFKISYFIDPDKAPSIEEINRLLHQEEQSVNIIFAFGQYLDIFPIRASKGFALRYVTDRWKIPLEKTLVAGGSGADLDMMRGNTLAVVVGNRHNEELSQLVEIENIYFAQRSYSGGILEAIEYYDFFNECRVPDPSAAEPEAI